MGRDFARFMLTFKISIFGHEIWPLTKVPEVAHILSFFLSQSVKIELIFALRAAVYQMVTDSQNCHTCIRNLATGKSFINCTYTLYHKGWEFGLFLLYGQPFPRNRPIFKIANLGHETRALAKGHACTYSLSIPRGRY